ncbi:MAG: hypothetical protein HOM11_08370 [Methylococcales bacterium]|jgi:hypothetical protein|nr:hypothetical protein [Methylococcales bacterium]MBT7445321.1 hypothetical protein [Methylococcales bacterium]
MLHILLHFIVPALVAKLAYRTQLLNAYAIIMTTMLVDLDHLLANPIYDPERCSIGFHPLHLPIPITLYLILCFIPKLRLIGLGLTIHMALDAIDCVV